MSGIYGSSDYAYGYDVMVAQKLADQMGMTLEVHKVEWDSIGLSLDAKEYDCIIAGMGRTKEREASYSFTEPYYYRDNCLVVKAGSEFEGILNIRKTLFKQFLCDTSALIFGINSKVIDLKSPAVMEQH